MFDKCLSSSAASSDAAATIALAPAKAVAAKTQSLIWDQDEEKPRCILCSGAFLY